MKKYELSVINVAAEQYVDAINKLAADFNCGDGNLSVKLVDANGNVFYSCHSFWNVDDYAFFKSLDKDILIHLYERVAPCDDYQQNIESALSELGLTIFNQEN